MTEDEIAIRQRLKDDFLHYASKCLYIRTKEGGMQLFCLNDAQQYIHSELEKQLATTGKIRALILKGRQQGVSSYTEGRFYWKVTHKHGVRAFILTHETESTSALFEMSQRYHDNCNPLLKPSTGASSAKELYFDKLDSGYKVGTAGNKAVGRGTTIQYFHGCLAAGTKIINPIYGGVRNIETFHVGDNIVTHTGAIAPISFISKNSKECVSVVFRTLGKFPLVATKEHRFFTQHGWKELGELREGDSIGFPVNTIPLRDIAVSLGSRSIKKTEISNGYAWLRIRSIADAGLRDVYDFEVDHKDHSYCTIHGATHNSEVAFWQHAEDHSSGILQTVPDLDNTEVILESTANGVGGKFHNMWMQAVSGQSSYIAIFVPWNWTSEYRKDATNFVPTTDELKKQHLYGVDNEQLAWRRKKIEEMGKDLADQEYPYCWQDAFLSSGRSVFNKELTAYALKNCWKPKTRMVLERGKFIARENGELRVWVDPQPTKRYVIGADVAEGLAHGDYSSAIVRELPGGEQCAEWHGHIAPDLFAGVLYALGKWYGGNALIGCENNNHGLAVNICLRDAGYPNIYVQKSLDDRGSAEKEQRRLGFTTTSKSKPYIIDQLSAELREKTHGITSKEVVQEMQTYIVFDNGSYGASINCFDDRVMAYAIAGEMLRMCPSYRK